MCANRERQNNKMTATSANNRRGIFKSKKAYNFALQYGLDLNSKKSYIHTGLYVSFDDVQFFVDNLWLDYFMGLTETTPIDNISEDKTDHCWWIDFSQENSELRIFSALGKKDRNNQIQLFAIGKAQTAQSISDRTLCVVEVKTGSSSLINNREIQLLNSKTTENKKFYLLDIEGFFINETELQNQFSNLRNLKLKIIGQYPTLP